MTNMRKKRCMNPACGRVFKVPSGEAARCPFCNTVSSRTHAVDQKLVKQPAKPAVKSAAMPLEKAYHTPQTLVSRELKGGRARKRRTMENLQVGSVVKGVVRSLQDCGAFVDIGGVIGMVHVTDLSWGRVRHPSDVVHIGQKISVKILRVDLERERIALSYKQTLPRPWAGAAKKYPVGKVVEGKVVRIVPFGAFVELEPGLDGLVHISQCALVRIEKVEDAVKEGDIVRVKVLDVNTIHKRITLSIREVLED